MSPSRFSIPLVAALSIAGLLSACTMLGPDYVRPTVATPAKFSEAQGWKPAGAGESWVPASRWWRAFGEPQLDELVESLAVTNQTVAGFEKAYRQAVAALAASMAPLAPSLTAGVTGTRGRNSTALATNSAVLPVSNFYRDSVSLSWQIDLWGQIRRTIESNEASAQVSAENLRGALLSAQAALVQAWVQRRVNEAQQRLLEQTQRALERSLQVTRDRYEAGVAPRTDVTQAETQLLNARAQAIELGVAHAQLSHAIAVLTGRPPGALSISASTTVPQLPPIPRMLPSQLLERRPDIVGAERQVASANALVGVAETAFYPTLSLSSALGITSDLVSRLASVPYHYWSVGPTVAAPIFDNGLRKAQLAQAQAAWEQTVAQYRQTVLVAFQEVEDALATLQVLEKEAGVQEQVVASAKQTLELTENQYLAGTVSYLNVVTAQTTLLAAQNAALDLQNRRLVAAITLIRASGGDLDNGSAAVTGVQSTPKSSAASGG